MEKKETSKNKSKLIKGDANANLKDIHLIVSKDVADKFQHVAKKSRISTSELFKEMVEI